MSAFHCIELHKLKMYLFHPNLLIREQSAFVTENSTCILVFIGLMKEKKLVSQWWNKLPLAARADLSLYTFNKLLKTPYKNTFCRKLAEKHPISGLKLIKEVCFIVIP